jgi:hypothetical protein
LTQATIRIGCHRRLESVKREAEIYCPKCSWCPSATDRWVCNPSCGTVWNTFWTRGLCPGCGHQWQDTACLRCRKWSPHESWYHYPDGQDESTDEQEIEREEIETT